MTDTGLIKMEKFLRIREVQGFSGLSRSQIYALVAKGEFPKQIKVSEKASAWLLSELEAWMSERIAGRKLASEDWHESSPAN
tara:strand:+ start:6256 stop:6501 length:246 start_codon:yes stop_codon:yes gene_type:complete